MGGPCTQNMAGDVLQLSAIVGRPTVELERIIGFQAGRLSHGYTLWLLDEVVWLSDFEWGATTSFPGNWMPSLHAFDDPSEDARVEDLKRWHFYRSANFDAARADLNFGSWKARQATLLNDRSPTRRIVKVVPTIMHNKNMSSRVQYPKAQGLSIRQWKLRSNKRFVFLATIGSTQSYQP